MVQNAHPTLLVVEPFARHRTAIESTLKQLGHNVLSSEDGADVTEFIEDAQGIHIILMNCEQPDPKQTGYEICESLNSSEKVRAVIMMNNHATREKVVNAIRSGASEFIVTPAAAGTLDEKIKKVISRTNPDGPDETPLIDFGGKSLSNAEKIDIIMEKATTIRALPHAAAKIIQLASSEDSAAEDLAKVVESDPSIAAVMMKRANSSFYSRGNPVNSIRQAVIRLGFKECKQLAVCLAVFKLFSKEEKSFGFSRIGYWLHSIACALITQQICKNARVDEEDSALTAGLLHDIGKLILDDFLSVEYQQTVQRALVDRIPFLEAEHAVLGRDHLVVGKTIVEKWRFSSAVGEVIGGHHNYSLLAPETPERPSLVGAVCLANQIAKALMMGEAGDFRVHDISPSIWQAYGFRDLPDAAYVDEIRGHVEEFCVFLGITGAELGTRLETPEEQGTAWVVDLTEGVAGLQSLFLIRQGFNVKRCCTLSQIDTEGEAPALCILRLKEATELKKTANTLRTKGGEQLPIICMLDAEAQVPELDGDEARLLRVVQSPVDCFDMTQLIKELRAAPNESTPVAAEATG